MFEEPIRFALDVIQRDRPVLELLYGQHTFVNAPLARHYGMPACRRATAGCASIAPTSTAAGAFCPWPCS
jgi:hypothetical protein